MIDQLRKQIVLETCENTGAHQKCQYDRNHMFYILEGIRWNRNIAIGYLCRYSVDIFRHPNKISCNLDHKSFLEIDNHIRFG